jgi:hypothetical protein
MAANLAGMFGQLNNAIQGSPLGNQSGAGQRMLNMGSQGLGNMGGAMSDKIDPYAMMTAPAQQMQGKQDLAQTDMSTPEGMRQAAAVYQKMGKTAEAMTILRQAESLEARDLARAEAKHSKNSAQLEAAGAGITETAERNKARAQKFQASRLAKSRGDKAALTGLESGALTPAVYIEHALKDPTNTNKIVGDGADLVDANGRVLYQNPKDTTGHGLPVQVMKDSKEAAELYQEAESNFVTASALSSKIQASPDFTAGTSGTGTELLKRIFGSADEETAMRKEAIRMKNSDALKYLPKGPASDRDVAIVMQGFPDNNSNAETWVEYLDAVANTNEKIAQMQKAKAIFIDSNGDKGVVGWTEEWDRQKTVIEDNEMLSRIPPEYLQLLIDNPSVANAQRFKARYGVLPRGVEFK